MLAREQLCVCHLSEDLGASQPLISHHLRILREAGVVASRRFRYWTYYRLRPDALAAIGDTLDGLGARAQARTRRPVPLRGRRGPDYEGRSGVAETLDPLDKESLKGVLVSLEEEFAGIYSPETVERYVAESLDRLTGARVVDFIPLFVHRYARERLSAAGQAEGVIVKEVPEVLFVCVHNAGRSQLAAALLNHHAAGKVRVRSAGSTPAGELNPAVIAALDEWNLDISQEFPKPLTDEFVRAADVVITMGCGDACPVYPGKRYLDWDLEDPAGKPVEQVREIRDEIDRRVRALLDELVPAAG